MKYVIIQSNPCEICKNMEYEFVPFICDNNEITFEIRCKICGHDQKELYKIKIK